MIKIGDTSGLVEARCDEKKSPIKVVGDIVDKLAKKCCDVPKKMRIPSKIIELTNGCFSSAQVITVSDEFAGSSDEDSDSSTEGDAAAADAASTGGGCGGGRSPAPAPAPSSGACGGKSCSGGKKDKSVDPLTGQKIADMIMPQTIDDIINSDYSDKLAQEQAAENDFRNKYCVYEPYPECATCPYRTRNLKTQERDIAKIFKQIDDAIQTLMQGNYSLANKMFSCPGQMKMLMTGDFRPMAAVAVPNAVSVLTNLVAARGALDAFDGIATAAQYTDFRREVLYAADKLFKSGSMIGVPKAFTNAVGSILNKIGCSPNTLVRLSAATISARDTGYGPNYNMYGSRCCGKNKTQTPYRSEGRRSPSPTSVKKAEQAKAKIQPSLDAAKKEIDEAPLLTTNTSSRNTTITTASTTTDASTNRLQATSDVVPYTPTTDKTAQRGKTYYRQETTGSSSTSGSGSSGSSTTTTTKPRVYTKVECEPGDDLEQVAAKNGGQLFEIKDNGWSKPEPTPVRDQDVVIPVITTGREYFYRHPVTGEKIKIETQPGEDIDVVKARVGNKWSDPDPKIYDRSDGSNRVITGWKLSSDGIVDDHKQYYISKEHGRYTRADIPKQDSDGRPVVIADGSVTLLDGQRVSIYEGVVEVGSYNETEDTVPVDGKYYYTALTNGAIHKIPDDSVARILADPESIVYEKSTEPVLNKNYTGDAALVLDDGTMVSEPVFVDAADLIMSIDTRALVTKTGVKAGDLSTIAGLGLTEYEIKMACILDHETNGSVIPDDVEWQLIPTILDEVTDDMSQELSSYVLS